MTPRPRISALLKALLRSVRSIALPLLAVPSLAVAQIASTPTQRIEPMSTDTQVTAFFYQKPTVLDREKHKGLRLKAADAKFAAKNQAVPLLVGEFPEACLEYPIVFTKGQDGRWMALALTGMQNGSNAFVNANGQWTARYLPASVRRYPFILAEGPNNELSLAADLSAAQLGTDGESLFNDKGDPTDLAKNVMKMLADFQGQAKATEAIIKQLDDAGLLTQQNLQIRLGDGRNASVDGVWVIDEAKLRELPDDKVLAWFKGGQIAAVHAHMLSLRNLVPLLERSQAAPTANAAATSSPNTGKAVRKAKGS